MEVKKEYYKHLDFIRVFFCIAVLLYHLNILKGGYLAVCSFFALSGYLSCISLYKKDKFSILDYYKNRFRKIYLPLLVVVMISIPIVLLIGNTTWLSMKPEVNSILLGYNNFWQLNANLDYFARHIDSPFMHLWYVGILLQFEIVFPIIFWILKKSGEKIHRSIPCVISYLLGTASFIYFVYLSTTGNIMASYYNTFARLFSLFFGVFLGFVHLNYKVIIPKFLDKRAIIVLYIIILGVLFYFVDANSTLFEISMLGATFITCRLIDYATSFTSKILNVFDKIIKSISSVSYEIYLVQYPVIFMFQYYDLNIYIKYAFIVLIILVLSYLINYILSKSKKIDVLKIILRIVLFAGVLFGIYTYVTAKDYTKDLKELENQLSENELLMQEKQEEFEKRYEEEQEKLKQLLAEVEKDESKLGEVIDKLHIVGVGDSVMLGAVMDLYKKFPNGYFDAAKSRTAWVVNGILLELKQNNKFGDPILINMGSNGDCPEACKVKIMETCKDKKVFWVNVTNDKDVHFNKKIETFANKYDNLYIIDWNKISEGHKEYFIDGIHLTVKGKEAYINAIYKAIYDVYLEEYRLKKEEILNNHDKELKNRITFYGNKMLLNTFGYIENDYKDSKFIIEKDFEFDKLNNLIDISINDDTLTNRIVLAFDDELKVSKEKVINLLDKLKEREVYIVSYSEYTSNYLNGLDYENVNIIDFYEDIKNNGDYLMADKIHLTNLGNKVLGEKIKNMVINKEN